MWRDQVVLAVKWRGFEVLVHVPELVPVMHVTVHSQFCSCIWRYLVGGGWVGDHVTVVDSSCQHVAGRVCVALVMCSGPL